MKATQIAQNKAMKLLVDKIRMKDKRTSAQIKLQEAGKAKKDQNFPILLMRMRRTRAKNDHTEK